jgi:ABC-type lipoprotein release transport system permease subunit
MPPGTAETRRPQRERSGRGGERCQRATGCGHDAGHTGFDSEIWGDAEQMLQAFRRLGFSALIFRLADSERFDAVKERIESDPRLTLEAKRETRFYADQSEALSKFISYLGTTISVIFSIGAIIGAMITMYASVASRTGEIGTLRALGFSRSSILVAFLVEALLLGLIGGVVGLLAASAMQAISISTMNFQTFAELAFSFALTPRIVVASLVFALAMGFVGGFLPAARAARLKTLSLASSGAGPVPRPGNLAVAASPPRC